MDDLIEEIKQFHEMTEEKVTEGFRDMGYVTHSGERFSAELCSAHAHKDNKGG